MILGEGFGQELVGFEERREEGEVTLEGGRGGWVGCLRVQEARCRLRVESWEEEGEVKIVERLRGEGKEGGVGELRFFELSSNQNS